MIGRLRRAAPWPVFLTLVLACLVWEGFFVWMRGGLQAGGHEHVIGMRILYGATVLFASWRAYAFHPYFVSGYRPWLTTTPWNVDKPLPFGPIELDWPDALILGGLIFMHGLIPGEGSIRIIAVFLFIHSLVLTFSIRGAANNVPVYAALFGLGSMVRLWPHPWACAATGVITYLIVYDGLRISLRSISTTTSTTARPTFDPDTAPCGWPYDRLIRDPQKAPGAPKRLESSTTPWAVAPHELPARVSGTILDYLMWSLLLAWGLSCIGPNVPDHDLYASFLITAAFIVTGGALLGRSLIYTSGTAPSISAWGRIRNGYWFMPNYDTANLAILLIPITPLLVSAFAVGSGVPWRIVGPMVPATALFTALAMPPGLRRWRLIGRRRIVPGQMPEAHEE